MVPFSGTKRRLPYRQSLQRLFRIGKVRRHPGAVGDNSGFLVEEMVSAVA